MTDTMSFEYLSCSWMGSSVSMSSDAMRSTLFGSAAWLMQATKNTVAARVRGRIIGRSFSLSSGVRRIRMVMVLPFALAFVAALLAVARQRNAAIAVALVTVVVQVWWLFYHATDKLAISL